MNGMNKGDITMEIQIERGVPVPAKKWSGTGRRAVYPWREMEVGDSFIFRKKTKKSTAFSLAYRAGKMGGRKFIIRTMAEGIRCWRMS